MERRPGSEGTPTFGKHAFSKLYAPARRILCNHALEHRGVNPLPQLEGSAREFDVVASELQATFHTQKQRRDGGGKLSSEYRSLLHEAARHLVRALQSLGVDAAARTTDCGHSAEHHIKALLDHIASEALDQKLSSFMPVQGLGVAAPGLYTRGCCAPRQLPQATEVRAVRPGAAKTNMRSTKHSLAEDERRLGGDGGLGTIREREALHAVPTQASHSVQKSDTAARGHGKAHTPFLSIWPRVVQTQSARRATPVSNNVDQQQVGFAHEPTLQRQVEAKQRLKVKERQPEREDCNESASSGISIEQDLDTQCEGAPFSTIASAEQDQASDFSCISEQSSAEGPGGMAVTPSLLHGAQGTAEAPPEATPICAADEEAAGEQPPFDSTEPCTVAELPAGPSAMAEPLQEQTMELLIQAEKVQAPVEQPVLSRALPSSPAADTIARPFLSTARASPQVCAPPLLEPALCYVRPLPPSLSFTPSSVEQLEKPIPLVPEPPSTAPPTAALFPQPTEAHIALQSQRRPSVRSKRRQGVAFGHTNQAAAELLREDEAGSKALLVRRRPRQDALRRHGSP